MDIYFSVDVETDGPIPGPYSLLSFGIVFAGSFDGSSFKRPDNYDNCFYRELKPISTSFEQHALDVNGLDRDRLLLHGSSPDEVMDQAAEWVMNFAPYGRPVLVAYPLSFDWSFLYWYFVRFGKIGSPFKHSRCFDIKTAFAIKAKLPIAESGRGQLPEELRSRHMHTHNALDDAIEQAQVFANIFEWEGVSRWEL